MNFILWIMLGGILGWIASIIMHTNAQQGPMLNILVGIIGALLAGVLLTPLSGMGTIHQSNFSLPSLLLSLVGGHHPVGHGEPHPPGHTAVTECMGPGDTWVDCRAKGLWT
jgi:uncharacterized membrane protein YeaQ/YmgE (transglycosylase-associated protein family)